MPATAAVSLSGVPDVDGILFGVRWASAALTYSFPASGSLYGSSYSPSNEPATFSPLTALQQGAVTAALGGFAAVSGLSFAPVTETATNHGTLRFGMSNAPPTAWAYIRPTTPRASAATPGSTRPTTATRSPAPMPG